MHDICAKDMEVGYWIDGTHCVKEITTNSMGMMVFRCAYSMDGYPGLSIILPPNETVRVEFE